MASTSAAEQYHYSAMEEPPNWLEMPHELMAIILQKLGALEILNSARKVCTTWRRICKNPEVWKVIVIQKSFDDWEDDYYFERVTKLAVDLSCGELMGIRINGFGTDGLLDHIVLRSCKLKYLALMSCYDITGHGLIRAVERVPQLELLHLSNFYIEAQEIEVIGRNCPQLKSFKVNTELIATSSNCDENAFAIAYNMPELRRLQLFDTSMTENGLLAIVNCCLHLESLDICMCYDLDLDGDLRKLCVERIKDFKFSLHYDDDDFGISSRDVDLEPYDDD